jgi:hypothetical protein
MLEGPAMPKNYDTLRLLDLAAENLWHAPHWAHASLFAHALLISSLAYAQTGDLAFAVWGLGAAAAIASGTFRAIRAAWREALHELHSLMQPSANPRSRTKSKRKPRPSSTRRKGPLTKSPKDRKPKKPKGSGLKKPKAKR